MTEYGDLYGVDFVRQTKNAGQGKCQLILTRNNTPVDTDKTDYAYFFHIGFYAGEETSANLVNTVSFSKMNVDGYNLEYILKPIVNQINNDVHTFTFTNPQPVQD